MSLNWFDISVFVIFITFVVSYSMYKSRKEKTSEDYFLASRGLSWPLIGFSIVAANISTEQFVGMAGQAAGKVGIAVSGYQLFASIGIIIVAFYFLPRFLRSGIYTMPEYLEYRYNNAARGIMAIYTIVIYVAVTITAVLYSGGLAIHTIFGLNLPVSICLIGAIAAVYTTWGGLKAVAWADLFLGSALLIGGLIILIIGLDAVGGPAAFYTANIDRLHMVLPSDSPEIPWTALLAGLWIPVFYYCGLNQFIVQRTLAAKNLRQGQLGIVFAAALWLLVPFVIVMPGIISLQLYGDKFATSDQAFPFLIRNLIPAGIRGFMFAAICGAVMSSLASMLNSASTIFTMDIVKRYFKPEASQGHLVAVGRISTVIFVIIGCLIAPQLSAPRFSGVFHYIQEFQGYISPGILACFVFGFIFPLTPASAGVAALLASAPVYGILQLKFGYIAFLNRMAITFGIVVLIMSIITILRPLREPKVMPVKEDFDMTPEPLVAILGGAVIVAVIAFYIIFW